MTLSIITINYNNCDGLKRTIDSVVSQTFSDYEWIVIDGGSNDGSFELIEKYQKHFTYWVSEPDKGIYNAMNKGISMAKGEWLLFLNSGDWLYNEDILKKVFSTAHDADILYGDVVYHWMDKRGMELVEKPDSLSLYYFYKDTLCHQSTFYSQRIFTNHRYNENLHICSDWALYIQLLIENYKFEHLPFCISNFSQDGISTHLDEAHLKERQWVYDNCFPNWIKPDMEIIKHIEEYKKHIESHKSFKRIMNNANKRVVFLSKLIHHIEKIRKHQ